MKGISIFYNKGKIRMHANAYTDNGYGKAMRPFLTLTYSELAAGEFEKQLFRLLEKSQSGIPFKMSTKEERQDFLDGFGIKSPGQMGIGVHITLQDGVYSITPINKRGLFGNPVEADKGSLVLITLQLLGIKEGQPV